MIFRIRDKSGFEIVPLRSDWVPAELDLERFIVPSKDSENRVLNEDVFGEPLLYVGRQLITNSKKRADVLAIDRAGAGVIIELKRDAGRLGVETQALQYLADFSAYQGQEFVARFAKDRDLVAGEVSSFLSDLVPLESINRRSRLILIARTFDPSLYSLGEWLSGRGVAFRCIAYTPFETGGKRFLSFSVAFDRAPEAIYPLIFQNRLRTTGTYWHHLGNVHSQDKWWRWLVEHGQISAAFANQPGDRGEEILKGYLAGDRIIAYAKGAGAVGWGIAKGPKTYKLLAREDALGPVDGYNFAHRLGIEWKTVAPRVADGIPPAEIRERFGIYHPVATSAHINEAKADQLIAALNDKFERSR